MQITKCSTSGFLQNKKNNMNAREITRHSSTYSIRMYGQKFSRGTSILWGDLQYLTPCESAVNVLLGLQFLTSHTPYTAKAFD